MKATLITGASSGIGEAFARRLAEEKHNLVLVARREERLTEICDELMASHGIMAHYVAIDLNDYQADMRLFKETENHGLEVDWLINNAGFGSMGDFAEMDLEKELEMIGLNVMVLVALTHRYITRMRERKSGTIINVSSTTSFQPLPFMATYSATKAFVSSFTESIAEENREYGIRVMNLCPGRTETAFHDVAGITEHVIDRVQTADEVVEAALNGLEGGRTTVVSGWMNYLTAKLATVAPNRFVTRAVARALKPKIESMKNLDQGDE